MNTLICLCVSLSAALSAGPDSTPLAGVVVDERDRPVAGVRVYLSFDGMPPEVHSKAESDDAGQFSVTLLPETNGGFAPAGLALWVYKPGFGVTMEELRCYALPAGEPIRVVLAPAAQSKFRVLAPDGRPVAGLRIMADALRRGYLHPLPQELADEAAVITDRDGTAVFTALDHADIGGVRFISADFGNQEIRGYTKPANDTIMLQPVGRVVGRIVSDKPLKGALVSLTSQAQQPREQPNKIGGVAEAPVDEQGRFNIPAIVAGNLRGSVVLPPDAVMRADWIRGKTAQPNEVTELEIPLRQAVRVTGVVRERDTGKSVVGARMRVSQDIVRADFVLTDSDGQFQCHVLPGQLYVAPQRVPAPYIAPGTANRNVEIPDDKTEHTLTPIELVRGGSVRGKVVDTNGEPLAGATVSASWLMSEGSRNTTRWAFASTNERGEFAIDSVDLNAELKIVARFRNQCSAAELVHVVSNSPVTISVSESNSLLIAGRVVDDSGRPMPSGQVELWARSPSTIQGNVRTSPGRPALIRVGGRHSIESDNDGRFRATVPFGSDQEYQVRVQAHGAPTVETAWIPPERQTVNFAAVTSRRLRPISGRVVDIDGQPVGGATVIQSGDGPKRTQAHTDEAGRFRLDGVMMGPAFIFVEKEGFRFHGQAVDASQSTVELHVRRSDQPSQRSLTTLPGSLSREQALQLARQVLEPLAGRVIAEGEESDKLRTLEALARVDPTRVLNEIEKKGFPNPWFNDYLRRAVIGAMLKDSLDEALAIVESMQDPSWRATGLTDAADALPESERTRKLELLSQALLHARNVQDPAHRLHHMGGIAERWLDMGEVERGTQLLREGEKIARELPPAAYAGYARGAFAEELAQIDLAAALELTKDLSDKFEYDRHHGNIAHELGGKNPAEAERILGMMREPFQRDQWSPRVCYRMATADLKRARAIADKISRPELKAYTFGVMAQAWAGRDKRQAAELLREAFSQLQRIVTSGRDHFDGRHSSVIVAAALLPVAELIDPELVQEFLWQAISFRQPRPTEHGTRQPGAVEKTDSALALMVARYDRSLAASILDPAAGQLPTLAKSVLQWDRGMNTLIAAAVVIDPHRAVELVERMPDDSGLASHTPKNSARQTAAATLVLRDQSRWRSLVQYLDLWPVDTEDF